MERLKRAVTQIGTALEEARGVVRGLGGNTIRIRADDRVIELPVSWALAGLAAFVVTALVAQLPVGTRREREEEPLGIG